jgi:hypothetical protein
MSASWFGASYRAALAAHDELVSTSSVRELVLGMLDEHGRRALTPAQIGEIGEVVDTLSRIRLPTAIVGYALSPTDRMQHPTAAGTGLFADSSTTAAAHSFHDRARRQAVVEAMEEESAQPGASPERMLMAGARAAVAYTVNFMAAPITARNVKPFSLRAGTPDAELADPMEQRERVKSTFVALGGTQEPDIPGETDEERRGRPWSRGQRGVRAVSPARGPRSALQEPDET